MVLIYSHTTSTRLQYICNFIFKELLHVEFKITIDSEEFKNYSGICINYSDRQIKNGELGIRNVDLLFEETILPQQIQCFNLNNYKAFFKTDNSDFGFDIFAASFYLLSRYEEYLPHKKDMYGRFSHENSLAFKEGFLHLPLINIWVKHFADIIKTKFPTSSIQLSAFSFKPSYDIDIAYSYKHKGFLRNVGGFLKSPSAERIKVLLGLLKDPFDTYDWLHQLHKQYNINNAVYFFLVAEKNGSYDKNILPVKNAMWQLIKKHASNYKIGIHPSWQTNENTLLLKKELNWLGEMSSLKNITASRQHFIKFTLPSTYQHLIETGILDDYSMGYGSINGFRASIASSFYWFNLEKNEETNLRIHPFCFMDANCFYEQKQTPQQSLEELINYSEICREVGGSLITVFHNNFLGTANQFKGWKKMYEVFVKEVHNGL